MVDLPEPMRPNSATCSPALILNETLVSAFSSASGYLKLTSLNSISPIKLVRDKKLESSGRSTGLFITSSKDCKDVLAV